MNAASASEEELQQYRLLILKTKTETQALKRMRTSLVIGKMNDFAVYRNKQIEKAISILSNNDDAVPKATVEASRRLQYAKKITDEASNTLFSALDNAIQSVRDSLILRVQLRVELGDKGAFIVELERAYGSRMDNEEKSLCMNSFRKVVWEKFASAFESNAKKENDLRTIPRPPKKGGRRQPACALVVPRFPPGLENECRRLSIEQYWAEFKMEEDMELGNVDDLGLRALDLACAH